MKLKRMIVALALTVFATSAALAQSTALRPFPLGGTTPATGENSGVKIAVTYQFFMEGDTQSMEDQTKLADQGRKHLYLMLAQECIVLKETIADNCAIERASVNAQLHQQNRSKGNGVRISGSASYRIELKKDARAAKP